MNGTLSENRTYSRRFASLVCLPLNHQRCPSVGGSTDFHFFKFVVLTHGPGDRGSIPGQVIPKTQKMVLDDIFPSTQHYKVRIKGKVEQSRERSSTFPLHLGVVAIEKGAFGSPPTKVANFTLIYIFLVLSCFSLRIFHFYKFNFVNKVFNDPSSLFSLNYKIWDLVRSS